MTRAPSSVRSTTGAVYAPAAKPKAKAAPKARAGNPHVTAKAPACHCSPNPHHPCTHSPAQVARATAGRKKAAATKAAKAAAMTPAQRHRAALQRHASAVKAAATRAAHKKTAAAGNPHRPPAKKPVKKAC